MKNIIILFLFIISISPVNASEINGFISTNPDALSSSMEIPVEEDKNNEVSVKTQNLPVVQVGPSHVFVLEDVLYKERDDGLVEEKVLVLGFSEFANGSLLRAMDNKIYLVDENYRKHIKSLAELEKYFGQIIFDVSDDVLLEYKIRNYTDGDLIREVGTVEVFHIIDGTLKHILNLDELKANFAGQEIFNITYEQLLTYR